MTPTTPYRLRTIFGLSLVLMLLLAPASALAQGEGPAQGGGSYYVVRPGDTWSGIAATTGVPAWTIQEANPEVRHPHGYLWIGDRLWIPSAKPATAGADYWYDVKPGDDWYTVFEVTGVPVHDLKAANPEAAAAPNGWLFVGQRLWIPAAPPAAATTESTAAASATVEPEVTTVPAEATPAATEVTPEASAEAGYWYDVKPGDDWYAVFEVTGVPVHDLKVANPEAAADPFGWLYIGQRLWIPGAATPAAEVTEAPAMAVAGTPTPSSGLEATPEPLTLVEPTAVATVTLTATSAPIATAVPLVAATPEPLTLVEPTAAATVTLTATPAPMATAVPLVAATPEPTATSAAVETAAAPTSEATPPSAPAAAAPEGCPAAASAYPEAIAAQLNGSAGDIKALKTWLESCGVITAESGGVAAFATSGAGKQDVAVVIRTTPAGEEAKGQLLAYHSATAGYTLSHKVDGAGEIKLLKAEDINADKKPDLVYVDASCGAHTCFSTLFVDSWDGSEFQDWIKDEPTMADAEYSFADNVPGGQGSEILAHGGVINSTGAGPQRSWTETYVSPEGGPYESYKKVYDASSCLYHQILDADDLFAQWTTIGFSPAITAYEKAVADKSAKACGEDPAELTKLADFARFRLMVSWVSRGQSAKAAEIRSSITYAPLVGAINTFVNTMQSSRSIVQACRDVTKYAEKNASAWDFLSDWGYANPTFTAADLCPFN
jgi:LysM repeat protein